MCCTSFQFSCSLFLNKNISLSQSNTLLSHLQDESDVVFKAVNGKWRAVVVEISRMHKTGRAVLVGTTSVEQSDELSQLLQEAGITHEVRLSCNFDYKFFFPACIYAEINSKFMKAF